MSDFKQRLETEKEQLEERLGKLNDFLNDDKHTALDEFQGTLLKIQARAMDTYLQCLKARLVRL